MSGEFKTHFALYADAGWTACRRSAVEVFTSHHWTEVTCRNCLKGYRIGGPKFEYAEAVTGRFSGGNGPNMQTLIPKTEEGRKLRKAAELGMGYGGGGNLSQDDAYEALADAIKGDAARYQEKTARLALQGEMGAIVFQERLLRASELEKKLAEEIAEKVNSVAANKMLRAEDDIEPMGKLDEEPLSELLATIEVFRSYCRAVEALIGSGTVFDKNTVNLCRIILSLSSDIFKAVDNLKPPPD